MAIKLLMSWDIKPGREQEYFEFVVREWVPGLQRIGLEPTDAWYTMYGNSPQILAGGTTKNLKDMRKILDSEEWQTLKNQLLTFVDNYEQKVVKARGGFQM
ncbi:MAG TPA: hypothetical protein VI793_05095 [Anaerolineales bacterium]|nr:hypothetical protein [Anaerolineales bacterium]